MALYEFEEDEIFKEQANAIDPTRRELDKKLEDLLFVIARIPHSFPALPGTNIRRAVYDGSPRLWVWFKMLHGMAKIRLLSIEIYGPNEA